MKTVELYEELIWQLPGHFFIKDKNSKYIMANKNATKLVGLNSLDEVVGINDYDLKCDAARFADQAIQEDKRIIQDDRVLTILYILKFCDGNIYHVLATKKPWRVSTELAGVISHGNYLKNSFIAENINKVHRWDECFISKLGFYYIDEAPQQNISLSKKQLICLFFLLRGKSAKEISIILKNSCRTIETQINNLKLKFNCWTKSQLIEKAIELGYFQFLPSEFLATFAKIDF